MSTRDVLTGVLVIQLFGWVAFVLVHWLHAREASRSVVEPVVGECETCGKDLTAAELWELREFPDDDADLEIRGGGTYMSAAYCEVHFPADRQRFVP